MPPLLTAQRDDEIFDVVNVLDEVVGQSTRKDVHAQNFLHRSVHALAFGADDRVFLQKRSMLKDTSPGRWDSSCSGHLDSGESYEAAVAREVAEEIGVVIGPEHSLEPLFKLDASPDTGFEFVWVYCFRSEGPFVLHPVEIERGEWFTIAEVSRGIVERPKEFTRPFKYIWPRVIAAM